MRKLSVVAGFLLFIAAGSTARAQDTSKLQAEGGFLYNRVVSGVLPGGGINCVGGSGQGTYFFNGLLGATADVGGCGITGLPSGVSLGLATFQFGPTVAWRSNNLIEPFGHVLFGGYHFGFSCNSSLCGSQLSASTSGFAMTVGGGVDVRLTDMIAVRAVQVDYQLLSAIGGQVNNFDLRTGVVFCFGHR